MMAANQKINDLEVKVLRANENQQKSAQTVQKMFCDAAETDSGIQRYQQEAERLLRRLRAFHAGSADKCFQKFDAR